VVKHQEGFFAYAHGSKRYYQFWLPESPPKAVLLLVHGLAEHSGRYPSPQPSTPQGGTELSPTRGEGAFDLRDITLM
jgi:hypothetical protein